MRTLFIDLDTYLLIAVFIPMGDWISFRITGWYPHDKVEMILNGMPDVQEILFEGVSRADMRELKKQIDAPSLGAMIPLNERVLIELLENLEKLENDENARKRMTDVLADLEFYNPWSVKSMRNSLMEAIKQKP